MISSEQVAALVDAEIDLGLLRPPAGAPQLRSSLLHEEPLVLAVPKDDPLALRGERAVAITEIDPARLIAYSPQHPYFTDLITDTLGLSSRSDQRISQVPTAVAAVNAGRGIALVPRSAARLGANGVAFLPLAGVDPGVVKLAVAWRDPLANPAAKRVRQLLIDRFAALTNSAA